jgi:LacI family transcriptional regulator
MPVTQKDIAREVGVSQTVVSDVLQGRPRGRVSSDTRERILETAQRLAYRPNASACALRLRRSQQIAYLLTQGEADQFHALGEQIIGGVARGVARRGYRLVLQVAPSRERQASVLTEMLSAGVCDGCVLRAFDDAPELWRALRKAGCPVVVIGQVSDPQLTSVAHDVPGMVRLALEHLAARGHARAALISSARNSRFDELHRSAWEHASAASDLRLDRCRLRSDHRAEVEEAAYGWLSGEERPSAVVCHDQRSGLGVAAAARRAGLALGRDLDLVVMTTNAAEWACEPGTWCLRTNPEQIGRRAADEVLRMLEGAPPRGAVRLLPELVQV